jgi:glucans biosynthesis protein C
LALPAIVLSLFCDPSKPLTEFYAGWPLIIYLWLTLAGFLVVSHDRLQESIQQLRWVSLPVALVAVGLFISLFGLAEGPGFGTPRAALALGLRGLSSWCFILAILGFGGKYLDFSTLSLTYANEAVLPFYILHQTVLLVVGYFVVRWTIPDLLKWAIIVPVSFAIIMVLYEFLVRRFNVMRFLFGMKPLPKALDAQPQEAAPASRPVA